jgi:plasmid stabilization system protein ParE
MVKWTDHAKAQLHHIHDYIAQDSAYYAKRLVAELVNKTIGLDELPHMGKVVAELNDEKVREVSLYSYRILYEINLTQIDILAVIHKRRDLKSDEIPR